MILLNQRAQLALPRYLPLGYAAIAILLAVSLAPNRGSSQSLAVGSVSGARGSTVWFSVSLDPEGISIAGVGTDLIFDSDDTPVKECVKYGEIEKSIATQMFPIPCGGAGEPACGKIRVMLFDSPDPNDPPEAILTPTILFLCRVEIPSGAASGSYPVIVDAPGASDPIGQKRQLTGVSGVVSVTSPTPPPGPGPGPGCS